MAKPTLKQQLEAALAEHKETLKENKRLADKLEVVTNDLEQTANDLVDSLAVSEQHQLNFAALEEAHDRAEVTAVERQQKLQHIVDRERERAAYYQDELVNAHALMGRLTQQLSELNHTARLTSSYPATNTDNRRERILGREGHQNKGTDSVSF